MSRHGPFGMSALACLSWQQAG